MQTDKNINRNKESVPARETNRQTDQQIGRVKTSQTGRTRTKKKNLHAVHSF